MNRRHRGCPTDGELRIALDADDATASPIRDHANQCAACHERLTQMQATADWSSQMIAGLAVDRGEPDVNLAYNRFRTQVAGGPVTERAGGSRMGQFFATGTMRAASAAVAVVAVVVAITFTPMRTVADDFLNQFRVQKFAAVTIPMDTFAPLQMLAGTSFDDEDAQGMMDAFDQFGVLDTTFEFDEHGMPDPLTLEDAEAQFGDIDEPSDLPDGYASGPTAYLTEAGSASYSIETETAQAMIDALNLPIYSLPDPEQYPMLEFGADIPAAALLEYQNDAGERIVVGQMASPSLNFPDGLDMNALREDILQFPGLPADLVAQLRAIDDWESTLIIPVPEGAETDDISINGEPGLLITHELGSAILWEKDGILFAVIGQVSDDDVREVADSMQ